MDNQKTGLITLRRVLSPVDFSDFSKRAFEYAVAIARWFDAKLVLLHVAPLTTALGSSEAEPLARELRAFADETDPLPPKLETVVVPGSPAGTILEHARQLEADLVVMGTHGRTGFERLMLGSVAEKVVLKASCAVLTVPRAVEGDREAPLFRRIVCGIDFSDSSGRALQHTLSLAAETGGHVTLIHSVEWMADVVPTHSIFDFKALGASLVSEAGTRLERLVPSETREWCDVETIVCTGKPYQEILRLAAERQADLIVLGVQGRGAVDRMLFGSTTQHVVRKALCPVLTVRT